MTRLNGEGYVLGLGSNVGFPLKNLRTALRYLKTLPDLTILKISSVYRSDAQLPDHAPNTWDKPYLNFAVLCQSALSPRDLHTRLQAIEKKMGRKRDQRWEPRLIDIDILAWGNLPYEDEALTIPHRSLWNRPFALFPLLEIFPEFEAPQLAEISWLQPHGPIPFHTQRINACLSGPALMGIVNVTPDSFSDGNQLPTLELQSERIKAMILAGAEVIDIGAESTRPSATPISRNEEWQRLEPLLSLLNHLPENLGLDPALIPEVSLDSFHPEVVEKALQHWSIQWVNDVSGEHSQEFAGLLKHTDIRYVTMHNLGVPPSPHHSLPKDQDPIKHLGQWAIDRLHGLQQQGFKADQLIVDCGIGFGLTPTQNWEVLKRAGELKVLLSPLGIPLLIGHSRKSFLKSTLSQDDLLSRDIASSLIAFYLAEKKIDYLRIHAVPLMNQAMKVFSQLNV